MTTEERARLDDPSTLNGLIRGSSDTGQVTLSGRCGDCGYLLESPGHKITCETGG